MNHSDAIEPPPGEVSGALLLGLIESFGHTHLIDPALLPFAPDEVSPDAWYPYPFLVRSCALIEDLVPGASSILFWAGVRFIERWYRHGPGKSMINSGMDWVYCNDSGSGFNSAVRGSTAQVGWVRNLVVDEVEGFALIENVMPLPPEYLNGIYYGGFLVFDDMAYFNTETESVTSDPALPFQRTVTRLTFRPVNTTVSSGRLDQLLVPGGDTTGVSAREAEEVLWRYRHVVNLGQLRERHNQDISTLMSAAFDSLQRVKEELLLSNEKLVSESTTDPLTGLHNKRYFDSEIPNLLGSARRRRHSIGVIMVDIDFFKLYNDHHGHLAGDQAIRTVADCIEETFTRGEDLVARFGGEEFVCVTVDADEAGIASLVEQLMMRVRERRVPHMKSDVAEYLTISAGSAILREVRDTLEETIRRADESLYLAKDRGRDRHVHSVAG